jgi:methylmalonyl-CoA mutase N-terminal domain/subunit
MSIKDQRQHWRRELPERSRQRDRGRPILFTPDDVKTDYQRDLSFPGEYPYTRGIYPGMYAEQPWRMIQQAGYGTSDQTNDRFKFFIQEGADSASVTFDMPTVRGLDSDHPMAVGEVGQVGQPIDTLDDLRRLIDGVPLDKVHIALLASHQGAPAIFAMFVEAAVQAGYPAEVLRGTIQNEFLSFYQGLPRSTAYKPACAVRLVADTIAYCQEHLPAFIPVNVTAEIARELGATATQELALTMANGMAYVEAAIAKGADVDRFGPQIAFYMGVHNNFFEEVAKYRAARRMWARIMRERFGATNPKAWRYRVHAQENASTATAQQPHNNIIRGTIQAMAAVLGGVQSLDVNPFDEALAIPTEESNRIALRTQQILAHESGITDVIDPMGGSYYLEWLTDQLEAGAQEILEQLETWGEGSMVAGVLHGIDSGYFENSITEEAHRHQVAVEAGEKIVVGVNKYVNEDEETELELTVVDPELETLQKQRLANWKAARDDGLVERELALVAGVAKGEENLIPPIRSAVRAGATLGEICEVLRQSFGLWRG